MEIISFRDLNSDQSRRISGSHYLLLYGKIEEETHIIGSFDHYAYVHDATQSTKIQKKTEINFSRSQKWILKTKGVCSPAHSL